LINIEIKNYTKIKYRIWKGIEGRKGWYFRYLNSEIVIWFMIIWTNFFHPKQKDIFHWW